MGITVLCGGTTRGYWRWRLSFERNRRRIQRQCRPNTIQIDHLLIAVLDIAMSRVVNGSDERVMIGRTWTLETELFLIFRVRVGGKVEIIIEFVIVGLGGSGFVFHWKSAQCLGSCGRELTEFHIVWLRHLWRVDMHKVSARWKLLFFEWDFMTVLKARAEQTYKLIVTFMDWHGIDSSEQDTTFMNELSGLIAYFRFHRWNSDRVELV